MNREIKFRVYDKKLKKYMTLKEYQDLHAIEVETDGTLILSPRYRFMDSMMIDTDAFDVQEFTGLHDKNGKEIYEGEIVEIDKDVAKTFDIYSKGIINYLNGGFIVTKNDGSYETIRSALLILGDLNNIFRGKVIGNIYENPDLLKGADNIE